ncbi:MAG TPA: adventurous gliding motility protein CglE [Myxococcales bacterium]|nr:adventurous gliding motility protein CglE [Myxococcales bacterium]
MKRALLLCLGLGLSGAAGAATPPHGVPLQVRRGFYTETDIGAFFTLGGNDLYSNPQSYLQLGVGVDLWDRFSLSGHVAFGANAFNCFSGRTGDLCAQTDAFTLTFFDVQLAYLHALGDRFYLAPKVLAGQTLLDPAPVGDVTQGLNLGAGLGVEYATSMDHFSVGMDVVVRYVFRANIPAFSVFPKVKYTF